MNTKQLTSEALDAFWEAIVRHFPQTTTGDLSPLTCVQLDQAAETAIEEWIMLNVKD